MTDERAPDQPSERPDTTEMWRQVLTGEDPGLPKLRRRWMRIPSSPRCKLCAAPFRGPGRLLTLFMQHGP